MPGAVPRRKIGRGVAGRFALIHALAHIGLNAIDLAWDIIARFAAPRLPRDFVTDWIIVATEEAKHFALLAGRLHELGGRYGDLPAHDGLWQAAMATRHDLTARLAVVPLVLEARGLDVTPAMIAKLEAAGDDRSAAILRTVYRDAITHVATGTRWFQFACAAAGWEPASAGGAWCASTSRANSSHPSTTPPAPRPACRRLSIGRPSRPSPACAARSHCYPGHERRKILPRPVALRSR